MTVSGVSEIASTSLHGFPTEINLPAPSKPFASVGAFQAQLGKNGTLWLEQGKSFKISLKDVGMGSLLPELTGLDKKNPAFKVTIAKGFITVRASSKAVMGTTDAVDLRTGGSLTQPSGKNPIRSHFPFTLAVGTPPLF